MKTTEKITNLTFNDLIWIEPLKKLIPETEINKQYHWFSISEFGVKNKYHYNESKKNFLPLKNYINKLYFDIFSEDKIKFNKNQDVISNTEFIFDSINNQIYINGEWEEIA